MKKEEQMVLWECVGRGKEFILRKKYSCIFGFSDSSIDYKSLARNFEWKV